MVAGGNIEYSVIFNKSVAQYEICFQMLDEFKNGTQFPLTTLTNPAATPTPPPPSNLILEPLVKPIYKDSIDKVEEVRSILWNL